jgi:hypothetical protein
MAQVTKNQAQSYASADELVALGDKIYGECREAYAARGLKPACGPDRAEGADERGNLKALERLHDELHKQYQDFAYSFPIVVRWMVYAGEYSTKALRNYIQRIGAPVWKTRQDFLESQADYLLMLYRVRNPRSSAETRRSYRRSAIKFLKDEDEKFKEALEEADEEVEEARKEADRLRRQRLRRQLEAQKAAAGRGAAL